MRLSTDQSVTDKKNDLQESGDVPKHVTIVYLLPALIFMCKPGQKRGKILRGELSKVREVQVEIFIFPFPSLLS
jgi:hypothetical protein